MRIRISRVGLTFVTGTTLALALAAVGLSTAGAAVKIHDSETGAELGEIRKAECRIAGKKGNRRFKAIGESPNGEWAIGVHIREAPPGLPPRGW